MSMGYEAELHSQTGAGVEAFLSVAQRRNFPKAAALGIANKFLLCTAQVRSCWRRDSARARSEGGRI